MDRRLFVKKLGWGAASLASASILLEACSSGSQSTTGASLSPSLLDDLELSSGLDYQLLIKELDPINNEMSFGSDNAGMVFLPESSEEGYLWINHESVNPTLASGFDETKARHRDMIHIEMYRVGGTILKIKKKSGQWVPVRNDLDNYRVTGASKVPLNWEASIEGFNSVVGTVANRGACKTPWGTILSAERDYRQFYGEYDYKTDERSAGELEWQSFFPEHHPHHFGWVVEVEPRTGSAKKHIAMGRMCHGDVVLKTTTADGKVVVYTTDDQKEGCIYKFIADDSDNLSSGQLFVANLEAGHWELLDISRPELTEAFGDQTELLIRTSLAARLVGGTALDSPSGLVIDPESGDLVVSVRGGKSKGAILRIQESGDRVESLEIVSGGTASGFVHPSAMTFGVDGRLWFASAIAPAKIGKTDYEPYGNNGLFVMDLSKSEPPIRMASAPKDAAFAGMHFTADGETMFLSVQHPGAQTQNLNELTSNWPGGGTTVPLSAVVTITGSGLNLKYNPT